MNQPSANANQPEPYPAITGSHSAPTASLNQLEQGFKETTDAAIAEGEQSVEEAMAAGAIYIEKAKSIAGNALASAQSYIPSEDNVNNTGERVSDAVSSIQATAASAIETTLGYISTAQSNVQAAAQPHLDRAKTAANEYLGNKPERDDRSSTISST